ncbi:hypothetical protein ACHAWF_018944 [Thalassiosira exigua]
MTAIFAHYFIDEQAQGIEIVCGGGRQRSGPVAPGRRDAAMDAAREKPSRESPPSDGDSDSFHTPRTSSERTPRRGNPVDPPGVDPPVPDRGEGSELVEPRFSNLSEGEEPDGRVDAKLSEARTSGSGDDGGDRRGDPPSRDAGEAEPAEDPGEISRRLVEYFVVVSCAPKARRRPASRETSPRSDGDGDGGESVPSSRHNSQRSQRSQHPSLATARAGARRAHFDDGRGCGGVGEGAGEGSTSTDPVAANDDARPANGGSEFPSVASIAHSILGTPPPAERKGGGERSPIGEEEFPSLKAINDEIAELPSLAAIGDKILGQPSPAERKSLANLDEADRMIGDAAFGEALAASGEDSTPVQKIRRNFLKAATESRRKVQDAAERMNAQGLQNLRDLERSTSELAVKLKDAEAAGARDLRRTLKDLRIKASPARPPPKPLAAGKEKKDEKEKEDARQEAEDGGSGSSDSSLSSEGRATPRVRARGATFRPSPHPAAALRPAPPTSTPPWAANATSPPPLHPLSPVASRGATDNIRISPLPDPTATPGGASDNIRIGHNGECHGRAFSDDDLEDCVLEPVVTGQYPPVDRPDQPLNPMLPQFCHPQGIDALVPSREYKMPTVHHFVLTDASGSKLYGTCLTVHEELSLPSRIEIMSGERNNSCQSTDEGEERGYVECSANGSPRAGRSRRSLSPARRQLFAPRVLCILSTWPYLSAFRTYLVQLYRLATTTDLMTAPLERYVLNICSEVPAPPPGSFEVRLSILDSNIRFWAPPADQPIPYVGLPYGVLFECLDVGNVLFAWYTLACERKVLLVSSQLSLLTVCAEILCSMIFPMRWSHLYIPCLPRFLTPMLDAPMPYLCGISREVFSYAVNEISDETIVVDLDRNMITMGRHTPDLPMLPHRRKMKLEASLERHAGDVFWNARGLSAARVEQARLSGDDNLMAKMLGRADAVWDEKICVMDEAFNFAPAPDSMTLMCSDGAGQKQSRWDAVQEAFLRFYVSMLKDYRKFMPSIPTDKRSSWRGPGSVEDGRFLVDEFVQSQLPDFQPFLEELVGTQMFDDFVTRRMYNAGDAPDVKFFDQSIDAKKNRSKLKLKKKETPFLHSAIAHRDLKKVDAIQPNRANLPFRSRFDVRFDFKKGLYRYPTWPESFDETLFGQPRPIPKIITAEFDRRAALTGLLRARRNTAEGRQLGSNNPSPEATAFVLFFVTFTNTIGKEWKLLEERNAALAVNMLDDYTDGASVESCAVDPSADGPWKPKVNPPWMAGESFYSLHSSLCPPMHSEPHEEVVHDAGQSNELCDPDCTNFCSNVGRAIDPSTLMSWTRKTPVENETIDFEFAKSPSEEERELEVEKARAVAMAQIDLGFNTLKMMRKRELPTESITYKTLIEACGRCGIAHRAQQLMEMMTQDGMALDSEVYYAFIKAFSNAESEAIPQHSKADTCSEFSANKSIPSVTSSSLSFLNSSQGETEPSTKKTHKRSNSSAIFEGFQNAVQSTIAANRRAFKTAKMKRMKRLYRHNLTKKKNLHVTKAMATPLQLGYCLLEDLYPGIKIDTDSDTCPKCSCVLRQDSVILGWTPCQVKDFSTTCPSCKHRFVPKFSVSCKVESFEGSQGKGTPLYCDYLSPWVLLQEIRSLIAPSIGGKAAQVLGIESNGIDQVGVDVIIDPQFREGNGINATLWWNMIVTFSRFKIPYLFLLQGSYENQQLIMPTLEDV